MPNIPIKYMTAAQKKHYGVRGSGKKRSGYSGKRRGRR